MFKKYILLLLSIFIVCGNANARTVFDSSKLRTETELTSYIEEGNNVIPIGAIIAWPAYSPIVDEGVWLECNGDFIPTQYAELIAIVGARTPNYQGMFLRGHGNRVIGGINYTSGDLYTPQIDTLRELPTNGGKVTLNIHHMGGVTIRPGSTAGAAYWNGATYHSTSDSSWNYWYQPDISINLAGGLSTMPTSNELRPVNMAVRYFIKAAR